MIIRDDRIVAAGALLPLAETSIHTERFGTRHRAALGITEQTDAVVVVVSEENGQISLVERARIVRNLNEAGLARAIQTLLDPADGRRGAFGWRRRRRVAAWKDARRGCASWAGSSAARTRQRARRHPPPSPAAPRHRAPVPTRRRHAAAPPPPSRRTTMSSRPTAARAPR